MNEGTQADCCGSLFSEFEFSDLRTARPPDRKGVYAIRVKRRGKAAAEIVGHVRQVVERLNWPTVGEFILSRVNRLERIGQCPIVYMGSAGTRQDSKNTLARRYKEFSGRHTAMYPLWALIYSGWELEFGWIETSHADETEKELKARYKQKHGDKLPAIVER